MSAMRFQKLFFLPLLSLAVLITAAGNVRAEQNKGGQTDFNKQLAQRAKQYQESLRLRTAQVAPSLNQKVESQTKQIVRSGLARLQAGKLALQIALPQWHAAREIARFAAKHSPRNGLPGCNFGFGSEHAAAPPTAPATSFLLKHYAAVAVNAAAQNVHSLRPANLSGDILAYFVRIVRTVVMRN